jgi:hypothetical protein
MSLDVYLTDENGVQVFDANITHNLNKMAMEAGIYKYLWRPDENGITHARDLIGPLEYGLQKLIEAPSHYKTFDAANGWGRWEHFVPFVAEYLEACKKHSDALVNVSR